MTHYGHGISLTGMAFKMVEFVFHDMPAMEMKRLFYDVVSNIFIPIFCSFYSKQRKDMCTSCSCWITNDSAL